MMEAYFDDGTVFTVGNAFEWLTFLGKTKDGDVNYYAGVIDRKDFEAAKDQVDAMDGAIPDRLSEILEEAMSSKTEHIVID